MLIGVGVLPDLMSLKNVSVLARDEACVFEAAMAKTQQTPTTIKIIFHEPLSWDAAVDFAALEESGILRGETGLVTVDFSCDSTEDVFAAWLAARIYCSCSVLESGEFSSSSWFA